LFRNIWAAANADAARSPTPSADEIDEVLHSERLGPERQKRTYQARPSELPTGTIIADDSAQPFLVLGSAILPWAPSGYGSAVEPRSNVEYRVLTPPSIVRALSAGYPVDLHSSARQ
jgi:hypothetical protein